MINRFASLSCSDRSATGTEGSPAQDPARGPEPVSRSPDTQERPEAAAGLNSKLKKAAPPTDPSAKPAKEESSGNVSAKPEESLPGLHHLCSSNPNAAGDGRLAQPCDPGDLTSEPSKAAQDVKGTSVESPRDSVAMETAGRLSPSPSSHPAGDSEQGPSVHSSRDKRTDAEDLSKGAGAPTAEPPSAPSDKVAAGRSDAPEHSPGEQREEQKAGPAAPDRSPVKEKISSLRKVDRGHYRHRRDRSSSGERARDSRSRTEEQQHRRRHSYARERPPQDRCRTEHLGPHHPGHSDRLSPGQHRAPPRYGHRHSRSRGGSDQDWARHHPPEGEHSWGREKYYPEKTRWDRCRYYHDRYAPYAARELRDWKPFHGDRDYDRAAQHGGRPYKDYYKGRKGCELVMKEKEGPHFGSPRGGPPHALPLYPDKYSHGKMALGAEDSCHLADRFHGHESIKSRKRRYDSIAHSDSYAEKKAWRSLQRDPLEEPKAKKHKKSKKKKKSKDKHRERDSR